MPTSMSPASWLEFLERRLENRWAEMALYDAYFEGDQRLAFATQKWNEAFGATFAKVTDNTCPVIVEASTERLAVQGFRFGNVSSADDKAWDIWQANNMDASSDQVHTEAVKLGEAYWLVAPPAPGSSDPPRITAEHPSQAIVACAAGDRRRRLAGLKRWWGEDGYVYANLYLPDAVVKYRSVEKSRYGIRHQWTRAEGSGPNPLGEVPLITMSNVPSMLRGGESDLRSIIPLQDALNKLLSDMLIGSEYQAFPQRVLLGAEVPRYPKGHAQEGQVKHGVELKASQSRMWVFANENAKVSEFSAADLKNYIDAQQHLVERISALSRTPPYYISGQIVNASGDALKMAETGLSSKVKRKMPAFGEGHEDTMRLAFKAMGDEQKAKATGAETIWKDPESRSFGELIDGLVKLGTLGVPQEALWERAGISPQEIARFKAMESLIDLLGQQPPPPLAPGPGDAAV